MKGPIVPLPAHCSGATWLELSLRCAPRDGRGLRKLRPDEHLARLPWQQAVRGCGSQWAQPGGAHFTPYGHPAAHWRPHTHPSLLPARAGWPALPEG